MLDSFIPLLVVKLLILILLCSVLNERMLIFVNFFFCVVVLNDVVGRNFDGDDSDKVEDRLFAGQSQYTGTYTHPFTHTLSSI